MRISDWSSDVCSSDLVDAARGGVGPEPFHFNSKVRYSLIIFDTFAQRLAMGEEKPARPGARRALASEAGSGLALPAVSVGIGVCGAVDRVIFQTLVDPTTIRDRAGPRHAVRSEQGRPGTE